MTDVQFKPGDLVQYRRGGPVMRVIAAAEHLCYCSWLDEFGKLQHGTFEEGNLSHSEGRDSRPASLT